MTRIVFEMRAIVIFAPFALMWLLWRRRIRDRRDCDCPEGITQSIQSYFAVLYFRRLVRQRAGGYRCDAARPSNAGE
jgi:hypothetical protein